jgi:hypothetical protein
VKLIIIKERDEADLLVAANNEEFIEKYSINSLQELKRKRRRYSDMTRSLFMQCANSLCSQFQTIKHR